MSVGCVHAPGGSWQDTGQKSGAHIRRLALTRPEWSPGVHSEFPASFRAAAKVLVTAAAGRSEASRQAEQQMTAQVWPLNLDVTIRIIAAAAYPLSAWLPLEDAQ